MITLMLNEKVNAIAALAVLHIAWCILFSNCRLTVVDVMREHFPLSKRTNPSMKSFSNKI
jgi:hypothetical protein